MKHEVLSPDQIADAVRLYHGRKVILDFDLASLYGVTTFNLNKAVSRNRDRFPSDFVLLIPPQEFAGLIFQIGISKRGRGGRRRPVLAFTQEGVAMLSSVLRSERAVRVNIEIMRAFVRLRSLLSAHADLARRLDELEARYDEQFRSVFDAIRQMSQVMESSSSSSFVLVLEQQEPRTTARTSTIDATAHRSDVKP